MRIYNKWYKELWFWMLENKKELLIVLLGFVAVIMSLLGYIYFNKGGDLVGNL
jgi:hypothetical protein